MTDQLGVFTDARFDDIFSLTASLAGAQQEAELDVEALHEGPRTAIMAAVQATRERNPTPSQRVALILGEAGFGKTHLLAASLRKLAVDGQLYPAVLQMTAPVTDADYDRWLLETTVRELNHPYFAIPRLSANAERLISLLTGSERETWRSALQSHDMVRCAALASEFAPRLREEWQRQLPGAEPPPAEALADFLANEAIEVRTHPPLVELAHALLSQVPGHDAEAFRKAVDRGDEAKLAASIPVMVTRMRSYIQQATSGIVSETFLRALLLHYSGDLAGFDALSGQAAQAGGLSFPALETAQTRRQRLNEISLAAYAAGGAFVLAFDQLESALSYGEEGRYVRSIEKAVNLVQDFPHLAVVLASLKDVYEELHDRLIQSVRDRIRLSLAPTRLAPPNRDQLASLFEKRLEVVGRRAGLDGPKTEALKQLLPGWLADEMTGSRMREALAELARLREMSRDLGRVPSEEEFFAGRPSTPEEPESVPIAEQRDFIKEWQDHLDQHSTRDVPRSDDQRLALLLWAVEAAAAEFDGASIKADPVQLPDEFGTPGLQILINGAGRDREMRLVGLCTAPNRNFDLARQIESVLRHAGGACPIVIGKQPFPRSKTAQVAGPLDKLRHSGGSIADFVARDWELLSAARSFIEGLGGDYGFADWRARTRFLLGLVAPLRAAFAPAPVRLAGPILPPRPRDDGPLAMADGEAGIALAPEMDGRDSDEAEASVAPEREAAPDAAAVITEAVSEASEAESPDPEPEPDPDRFHVFLGIGAKNGARIHWDPHHPDSHKKLLNFGLLVTGDPGSGKTQTLRVIIDAMARANYPVCILDFKNDYAAPEFAEPLGLSVYNLSRGGLPFNPLHPVPDARGEVQPIRHIHTIAEVLQRVFRLGTQQQARLKNALKEGFQARGIDLQTWYRAEAVSAPGFDEVVELLRETKDAQMLLNRVDPLFDLGLFPGDDTARLTFANLLEQRVVLDLHDLPNDEIKAAIAEMIIIQAHGYALRGGAPRELRRLFVFDEAWRVKDSKRLEELAREGRAFGIAIAIGTQFPVDIPDDLAGSLETQLFLFNSEARHQGATVKKLCGSMSGAEAQRLWNIATSLKQLQGFLRNQQYKPYELIDVHPHYLR